MAEREGFEPSIEFPLYTLSKRAPSTTRPSLPLRGEDSGYHEGVRKCRQRPRAPPPPPPWNPPPPAGADMAEARADPTLPPDEAAAEPPPRAKPPSLPRAKPPVLTIASFDIRLEMTLALLVERRADALMAGPRFGPFEP